MQHLEDIETTLKYASPVAEWLMATNDGDYYRAVAIVDTWKATGYKDTPPMFIECIYDLISAIHEGQKIGTR